MGSLQWDSPLPPPSSPRKAPRTYSPDENYAINSWERNKWKESTRTCMPQWYKARTTTKKIYKENELAYARFYPSYISSYLVFKKTRFFSTGCTYIPTRQVLPRRIFICKFERYTRKKVKRKRTKQGNESWEQFVLHSSLEYNELGDDFSLYGLARFHTTSYFVCVCVRPFAAPSISWIWKRDKHSKFTIITP